MSAVKQVRNIAGLVGLVFGALGAARELREAKGKGDKLALANAILNALAVVTGAALMIRGMRGKDGEHA